MEKNFGVETSKISENYDICEFNNQNVGKYIVIQYPKSVNTFNLTITIKTIISVLLPLGIFAYIMLKYYFVRVDIYLSL